MGTENVFEIFDVQGSDGLKNLLYGTMFYLPSKIFREKVILDQDGRLFTTGADRDYPFLDQGLYIAAGSFEVFRDEQERPIHINCILNAHDGSRHWVSGMARVEILKIV
jgi:hypothetical protein